MLGRNFLSKKVYNLTVSSKIQNKKQHENMPLETTQISLDDVNDIYAMFSRHEYRYSSRMNEGVMIPTNADLEELRIKLCKRLNDIGLVKITY